ncbi:MAG: bifunctional UDP-sugar hydrolase/5'-nucleotidase [Propionibacteriaceae bacterium]|nr:bifunctional UDP-sugar hydrolase/5'-nucleotidase [Propionibacteriaceae bacterium]
MTKTIKRASAALAATALVASGFTFASATTAQADTAAACVANDTITLLGFNDFHGRILTNDKAPWTGILPLASTVEKVRADKGADKVSVISVGDNIGATIFESMVTDDNVAIDVLNALAIDASAVGNHELDKGWSDLSGRVNTRAKYPHLAANMKRSGAVAAPVKEYQIIEKAGLKIAIVGAVTKDVPSLVSPGGITGLTFEDPVAAVNATTKKVLDAKEADIVVAAIHEGAGDSMLAQLDKRIAGVFTAHTHETYVKKTAGGAPVVQSASYASALSKIELAVDTKTKAVCKAEGFNDELVAVNADNAVVKEISKLVDAAKAEADRVGQQVIGQAEAAISTPTGNADKRDTESPMTNMVAQMFFEIVGKGNADNFIGIQNPGGTRSSFDKGDITYKEAATTLPFANSLFTTQLTGAQVKQVLEEQWQRKDGKALTEGRTFLQVGLSNNVTYTYDASKPMDQRITSVTVNGKPIDNAKLYTMASGSFLISGGDNFHTFAKGVNTADAGRADLEAWVDWVKGKKTLKPDYTKRGVEVKLPAAAPTAGGAAATYTFANLDMDLGTGDNVSPKLANTTITATIGNVEVGKAAVANGAATVSVKIPANVSGNQALVFKAAPSGTTITVPLSVKASTGFVPSAPYTLAGEHKNLNGRDWKTTCEAYSKTTRCTTLIWGTTVKRVGNKYVQTNGWQFNNMTYLPAKKALWGKNPLANTGTFVSGGRDWETECNTARSGGNGCRSYVQASVIEAKPGGGYRTVTKMVFNNIVMFEK